MKKVSIGTCTGIAVKGILKICKLLTKSATICADKFIKDDGKKEKIKSISYNFSKKIDENKEIYSEKAKDLTDNIVVKSGDMSGKIAKKLAEELNKKGYEVSEENFENAGKTIGKSAIGCVVGFVATSSAISLVATAGTAGAAATTSGLAALGIATGGGGMIGGLATSAVFTTTSVVLANIAEKKKIKMIKINN